MEVLSASLLFLVISSTVWAAEKVKRVPFDSPGFSTFHNPSFFSKHSSSYESAPAPSYPAPSYPAHQSPSYPAPKYQAPAYKPPQPTHNCTIVEETSQATVCVPKLGEPECSPVTLKGVEVGEGEKCLSITRTVCTEGVEEVTAEVCLIKYDLKPVETEATLVEVEFNKECSSQMVTVCEPQPSHGYGYDKGSYQKCEEIAQETCYNKPSLLPKTEPVTVMVPEPSEDCGPRQFSLPTVKCEDITEERCVQLPTIQEADIEAEQCTVGLGEPACNTIDLTLPLQVCREQVYGKAEKPEPAPAYPPPSGYSN